MVRALLSVVLASATCGQQPPSFGASRLPLESGDDGGVDGGQSAPVECRACQAWSPVELVSPLPGVLTELSGLAASRMAPSVLYGHNDSGDTARLFAFTASGRLLAELNLRSATATDWEDMALGPCEGGGTCLFLADIGDNTKRRSQYVVYRSREPDLRPLLQGLSVDPVQMDLTFDRLLFTYPNGIPHNAETLLSHPVSGDLYVVTKGLAGQPSRVYKFPRPFTPEKSVTLLDLGEASVPTPTDVLVTGGDIHPCGHSVLARLYNRTVELVAQPDAGFESAFIAAPLDLPTPVDEPQGEAITWASDGRSFFTASEHSGQSLHQVRCVGW